MIALPEWAFLPDIGLYMDQVITLMERTLAPVLGPGEITKSMVNNYVKVGLIKRPAGKKYDREQLAQLLMIAVLKQALSMEDIAGVLALLCAEGTQAGYARFCSDIRSVEEAMEARGSGLPLSGRADTPQERAAAAGIAAAACAIHAKRLLTALREARAYAERVKEFAGRKSRKRLKPGA